MLHVYTFLCVDFSIKKAEMSPIFSAQSFTIKAENFVRNNAQGFKAVAIKKKEVGGITLLQCTFKSERDMHHFSLKLILHFSLFGGIKNTPFATFEKLK